MTIAIRIMSGGDLPLGMALKERAGWNQTEADWLRFLAMEPEGCFVAEWDGRPAGTTVTTVLGSVGWIAMVLVDEAVRGRGIGTRLVEHAVAHLERRPVATIRLDATPLGRPVYEKLGFVAEYEVARWVGGTGGGERVETRRRGEGEKGRRGDKETPLSPSPLLPFSSSPLPCLSASPGHVEPVTQDRLFQVAALDQQVTGTDRDRLIEQLYRQQPEAMRAVSVRGKLAGYAMLRPGSRAIQIGPAAALDPEVGVAMFDAALQSCVGQRVFIDIPADNAAASQWADANGLTVERRWMRMRRGLPVHDHPARLWASSGPENG